VATILHNNVQATSCERCM